MSRPIWKGSISFGLVTIPVSLYSVESKSEQIHFHLLDKRNHARIANQRINKITGKKVPWQDLEKAYEFEKGKYVAIDQKRLEKTAEKNYETVEILSFVSQSEIEVIYFNKPYVLLPEGAGTKAYLLLYQILKKTKTVGIATVVIKTHEYLVAILPMSHLLAMITLRYASDLKEIKEFEPLAYPQKSKRSVKITPKEIELAEQLVESMRTNWDPKKYLDNNKILLKKLIHENIKKGKSVQEPATKLKYKDDESVKYSKKTGEVIDFMSLLKKSISNNKKSQKKHA